MNKINIGDYTNNGTVQMIDNPCDSIPDPIVRTTNGIFRLSELTKIEKAIKPEHDALKQLVDFNTVMSLDIRPGKVISAKRIKDTDKLLELKISTVLGKKTVVTNLGSHFDVEDFEDKTFMFIMNMPPIKMRGILSEAMIMASTSKKFDNATNTYIDVPELIRVNIPINSTIL